MSTEKVQLDQSLEAFRLMLKAMPTGLEVRCLNQLGRVKRVNQTTWNLFADGNHKRSRWGDLDQMTADLTLFEANGHLPEQDMPRW